MGLDFSEAPWVSQKPGILRYFYRGYEKKHSLIWKVLKFLLK